MLVAQNCKGLQNYTQYVPNVPKKKDIKMKPATLYKWL